jgi:hypothetical protein
MVTAASEPAGASSASTGLRGTASKMQRQAAPLIAFWNKLNADWVFDLSSQLAYTFLFSIFPILLVILAAHFSGFRLLGHFRVTSHAES